MILPAVHYFVLIQQYYWQIPEIKKTLKIFKSTHKLKTSYPLQQTHNHIIAIKLNKQERGRQACCFYDIIEYLNLYKYMIKPNTVTF